MKNKMIPVMVAILLFALLAGCAAESVATTSQPKGGTLYITVNPVIAVTYDADGNVTAVTAVTEDAKSIVDSYQDFVGKECTEVVTELVTKIGEEGYLSKDAEAVTIAITFEDESDVPSKDFVEDLAQQVQAVVTNNQWQGTVTVEEPTPAPPTDETNETTATTTGPDEEINDSTTATTGPDEEINDSTTATTAPDEEINDSTTAATAPDEEINDSTTATTAPDEEINDPTTAPIIPGDNTQVTEPPVIEPANPGKVPADAQQQPDGTYILTEPLDAYGNPADSQSAPVYILTTVYNPDGVKISQTNCYANGVKFFYQEFYPNGNPKNYKRWDENGVLTQEFVAFHGENNNNGILKFYDEQGNVQTLDTFGNPDGSPDTSETWDPDGTHIVSTIVDGMPVEVRQTYADGSVIIETYDYQAGTCRVVTQRTNSRSDMITSMQTGEPIEGYIESTDASGIYQYLEYTAGYKCKEIIDGSKNPLGYKYKQTTCYYPNGQAKSFERYFYADGGRIYTEHDESGNTTYWEDTTGCNYAVVGP